MRRPDLRKQASNSFSITRILSFTTKSLNKDGHLITEDSVLPTTAPGGAPEQNRCYQTPATLLVLPLAPTSLARSAHLAPLTTLRPRWGPARSFCSGCVESFWIGSQRKGIQVVEPCRRFPSVTHHCQHCGATL
jgi:hypothetical protein